MVNEEVKSGCGLDSFSVGAVEVSKVVLWFIGLVIYLLIMIVSVDGFALFFISFSEAYELYLLGGGNVLFSYESVFLYKVLWHLGLQEGGFLLFAVLALSIAVSSIFIEKMSSLCDGRAVNIRVSLLFGFGFYLFILFVNMVVISIKSGFEFTIAPTSSEVVGEEIYLVPLSDSAPYLAGLTIGLLCTLFVIWFVVFSCMVGKEKIKKGASL